MLKTKIEDILKNGRVGAIAAGDRVRTGLAGRSRQVVALATLAAVAGIGLAAASLDNSPAPALTASAADAEQLRANAAAQADRATRETPATPATSTEAAPPATTQAAATTPKAAAPPQFVNPMPAGQLSSCYGPRWGTMHQGIDLFTEPGEPIQAVAAGTVVANGWAYSGYGISVTVDHHNGFLTHYAHMQQDAVRVGQEVTAGTVLGYEGTTGDSTGPHLHFEVHAGMWNQIDPAPWLRERGIQIGC